MSDENQPVFPILKWPGGKSWLAERLSQIIGDEIATNGTYYEPFLGAGSIYFYFRPEKSILSDVNPALINFYKCLRNNSDKIIKRVWSFSNKSECYYKVRNMHPRTDIGESARFLYLNKTCWGGVYRLNQKGEYNVPFGNSGRKICSRNRVLAAADALRNATLICSDFEPIMTAAKNGDCIYADPPYSTLGQNNGFLRYNERLFKWSDQQRLARSCRDSADRGAFVAISALWHDDILKLFPDWWAWKIERKSLISRKIEGRRSICEVVIFSNKPGSISENITKI